MVSEKRKIGDIGEKVAERFLVKRGFSIITRNYLKKWGEIDIVAKNKGILHFIEVKTVQSIVSHENDDKFSRETSQEGKYNPAENVHPKKLERMYRTIESYLEEKSVSREKDWQIDVVAVLLDLDGKRAKVNFIENIIE